MDPLESQIAKIYLQGQRAAANYVFIMAEKATGSDAELYVVADLPVLNPAAKNQCEQIALSISAALKRVFKRPYEETSFENAVALINEELGKLASMGQNYWINKLNCIIGVKNQNLFTIATCGKVVAYLLRDNQFSDINTSGSESHPLKTFDSFASGKLGLNDVLILSNSQLLNFVSMDRLRDIFRKENFLSASQTVIELLKQNAGPEVEFGAIFNKQVPFGQTGSEKIDLENYVLKSSWLSVAYKTAADFLRGIIGIGGPKRHSQAELPKVGVTKRLGQIKGASSRILNNAKGAYGDFSQKIKNAGRAISPGQIKNFSPVKKYLFISIAICVIAAALSVGAAIHDRNIKKQLQDISTQLKTVSDNLSLAESSLLYKDDVQALSYFKKAESSLPTESQVPKSQLAVYRQIQTRFDNFRKQVQKNTSVDPQVLGNLADSKALLNLSAFLATGAGKNVISYEKSTGKIEDGRLKTNTEILAGENFKDGQAVIYNGESLVVWDYINNTLGQGIISSVPAKENFVGLSYYPTNSRMYVVDTKKNQIISFLINKTVLQKPVVSLTDISLSAAEDITIDGNIYVLTYNTIEKFAAGKLAEFNMPFMFEPYEGQGKLYTQIGWQYLYLLDISKKRVIIMDKKGALVKILTSDKFTDLRDFAVDESQMTIYVLNGTTLLKVSY